MVPHLDTLTRLAQSSERALELGVRAGVSTWALLDGLPEQATLTSVDIVNVTKAKPPLPDRILADRRWSFIHGDDRLVELPPADFVFIDTSHEYGHTRRELERAMLGGARRIALHDFALPDVEDAVYGFIRRTPYRLTCIEPSEWGLAVIER